VIRLEPAVPESALAAIRAPFLEQEARLIETPVLQPLDLLLDISGEAMRPRLFVVQADGIDEACLRPDLTIGVAQEHIKAGARNGRYLYEGKAFRVAPPESERAEEFLQIGLESFGGGEPAPADAAVAGLAWRAACAGGRTDLTMELGDIALFRTFLDALGLPRALAVRLERAFRRPRGLRAELERAQAPANEGDEDHGQLAALLAGLPEGKAALALQELWSLAGVQPVGGRSPVEIVHRLAERAEAARAPALSAADAGRIAAFLAISERPAAALGKVAALASGAALEKALQGWSQRLDRMADEGVPEERQHFSPAFGRAFGYYDGFVFEVRSAALDAERPVAAGGRYDALMPRLGARTRTGAVGCMVRPWRAYAEGEQP
jgi:ATP phosphoribosyltransferase regulatory subunit